MIDHTLNLVLVPKAAAGPHASFSCGVASLKSLLSFWGVSTPDLKEWMAEALQAGVVTEESGFHWKKVDVWIKPLGVRARFFSRVRSSELLEWLSHSPLLVSLRTPRGGHVVLLVGARFESGSWTFYDPETDAHVSCSDEDFEKRFSGRVLRVFR